MRVFLFLMGFRDSFPCFYIHIRGWAVCSFVGLGMGSFAYFFLSLPGCVSVLCEQC